MTQRRMVGMVLIALIASAGTVRAQDAQPAAITAHEVHGGGGWKTDGKDQRAAQRWNLDVHRGDDNSIRGRVSVADSALFSAGNVEGRIDGHNVSGTISDDNGAQIASFDGIVTPSGMHGKYTDKTGETGAWSWDGPPPQ